MIQIVWKSLRNENSGCGELLNISEQEAVQMVEMLNKEYEGELHHWYCRIEI